MSIILSGATLANITGNDHYELKYSATGLGAVTWDDYVSGLYNRTYSFSCEYAAGGTLALTLKASNQDVAYGSVTQWTDVTTELLGSATISASTVKSFICLYRWLWFDWATTGTGNNLNYYLIQGW